MTPGLAWPAWPDRGPRVAWGTAGTAWGEGLGLGGVVGTVGALGPLSRNAVSGSLLLCGCKLGPLSLRVPAGFLPPVLAPGPGAEAGGFPHHPPAVRPPPLPSGTKILLPEAPRRLQGDLSANHEVP